MRKLQARILITLAYSAVFNYPLTVSELRTRLILAPTVSLFELEEALLDLLRQNLVKKNEIWWTVNLDSISFETRKQRQQISQHKWLEVEQAVEVLRNAPGLLGIAVTGSVAVNNASKLSDLDFMLVTAPGWMWLTRIWVIWMSWRRGKRRSFAHEEPNSWCFNVWLSSDQLALTRGKQSLYSAYEVCQATWVWQKSSLHSQFLQSNSWVKSYIPSYFSNNIKKIKNLESSSGTNALTKSSQVSDVKTESIEANVHHTTPWLIHLGNWCAYHLQRWYMLPHQTREIVNLNRAFFHPRSTRNQVMKMVYLLLHQSFEK